MERKQVRCKKLMYRNWSKVQCSRKPWKDGYCKQHHPDIQEERNAKRSQRWAKEDKKRDHDNAVAEARDAVVARAIEWRRAKSQASNSPDVDRDLLCAISTLDALLKEGE